MKYFFLKSQLRAHVDRKKKTFFVLQIQGDLKELLSLSYFQFSMNEYWDLEHNLCLTKTKSKTKKVFDKEKLKK